MNVLCQLIVIFLFLKSNKSTWTREIITNHTLKTNSNLYPPKTKQVQNNPHGHPHRAVDRPKIRGSLRRQGKRKKAFLLSLLFQVILKWYIYTFSKVYCSDILDAITKDFFARKGGAMDETTHVTDIQVEDKKRKKLFHFLRWPHLPTGLATNEQVPHCGNRERNIVLLSFRRPGRTTR